MFAEGYFYRKTFIKVFYVCEEKQSRKTDHKRKLKKNSNYPTGNQENNKLSLSFTYSFEKALRLRKLKISFKSRGKRQQYNRPPDPWNQLFFLW